MKKTGLIVLSLFVLSMTPCICRGQANFIPRPAPTPNPATVPLNSPRFETSATATELQRQATTGNPPGLAFFWHWPVTVPEMMHRPPVIPDLYPVGLNDGERFLTP